MAIAVLPYECRFRGRLADVALSDLHWPLGGRKTDGTVSDLKASDHLIIYPRTKYFLDPRLGVKCNISLLISEPYAVHRRHYLAALATQKRYFRIITHRPAMARWSGNALVMPFGGAWVGDTHHEGSEKRRNMSLIASPKRRLQGHALRHEIADWCIANKLDVDLLGHAYKPFENKADGLRPYRFSIIIENTRENGYFSEKLIDCLLCDTVPIYWGAPDIDHYFDVDGMFVCGSADEIKQAVQNATSQAYETRLTAIEKNHSTARNFKDYLVNAAQKLSQLAT